MLTFLEKQKQNTIKIKTKHHFVQIDKKRTPPYLQKINEKGVRFSSNFEEKNVLILNEISKIEK